MKSKRYATHSRNKPSGFTLVELMISIALSLLLILAINTIFKLSGDAVGTGYQVSSMTRTIRTIGTTMSTDTQNMADFETQPALIIQNLNTPAFRDATDMASEPNFTAGTVSDPSGQAFPTGMLQITLPPNSGSSATTLYPLTAGTTGGAGWTSIAQATLKNVRYQICDDRNHRTDMFSFFAKGDTYRRQTSSVVPTNPGGIDTNLESDFTGQEAWIWYGHVILPNNQTGIPVSQTWDVAAPNPPYYSLGLSSTTAANNDPSNSANPNNFYASQWVLGRVVTLMTDPPTNPTPGPPPAMIAYSDPYTKQTQNQNYLRDSYNEGSNNQTASNAQPLSPLGYTSVTNDTSPAPIFQSLCDLADATMETFRNTALVAEYQAAGVASDYWYVPLIAQYPSATSSYTPDQAFRFWGKPWPVKSPPSAMQTTMGQEIARSIPVFARGCSQFIVEYAGDYVVQDRGLTTGANPTGTMNDVGEDGQIDYDIIPNPSGGQPYKRIRWYGLTRSLDNGYTVEDAGTAIPASLLTNTNVPIQTNIVRPLWRYIQLLYATAGTTPNKYGFDHLPFEKVGPAGHPTAQGSLSGSPANDASFPSNSYPNATPASYQTGYTCAWAPDDQHLDDSNRTDAYYATLVKTKTYFPSRSMLPWLIRVTVRLDDPNGRVPQGQQMEFIFKVNRPH